MPEPKAGGHDRDEVAGLGLRHTAVEREIVAGLADRAFQYSIGRTSRNDAISPLQ